MRKTTTENELIKNECKIDCKWDNSKERWSVKITHITDKNAYSSVVVSVEGFDNLREATDKAVVLFKRNIRNGIRDLQTIREKYSATDIWPEIIYEPTINA